MCHSLMNGPGGVQYIYSIDHRLFYSRPMKTGKCHSEYCSIRKSRYLFGTQISVCWHHLPRKNFGKFLRLNAQSSPLFLSRTSENDCTDFNIWMSEIFLKETVINVSRVASLLCCCLLHFYVTYRPLCENDTLSFRRHCDSPNPADTNGNTGNGNQSRGNPSSSNQNDGSTNCGNSNSDGERNPSSAGSGGCDGGSNSGGGDGDKDGDKNSNSNLGSDDDGGDEVEERDEEDDDEGNDTEEEDIDHEASKENTVPPSQLSLVPDAVIEAAGGKDAIDDDKAKLLVRRLQPIYELVDSEQSYGKKLTFVKEKYIPAVNEESQIEIPDDLAQRWRILWGNWIQLYEWHSNFLSKLEGIYQTDPDRIPKLFIDSRARLRSIYSKYCENQRKATLIADQYRDFFDELRVKVGDKEDVQSYLMQPVQRIMRYQLPMGEILKLTQRANLASATQWQKALDLMKEIPKDTQMILEAARIDGFTGTITAMGNMRIRGDLQVATISRSDFRARRQVSRKEKSSVVHSGNGPEGSSGLELKFSERRVFLFEQMLLITEEVKSKRKDVFAQSTYLFKNALNVNRMSFEPHWLPPDADIDLDDDDDLKFVVEDTSPQCDAAYVLDPGSVEVREQWVIQLRDLQRMQHQLLLALQDPKRYIGGGGGSEADDSATGEPTPSPTSGSGAVSGLRSFLSGDRGASKKHGSSKAGSGGKKKKFPSFKKGKQRSKTEELPIALLSPGSSGGGAVDGNSDAANKNSRKESCPNTLSVLINPGEKKQVDSRKGNLSSDVHHQSTAGALISGRASADLQQPNDNIDGDALESPIGCSATGQQSSHQPSKKKFSVFNLFGKNKHHHHHHHNQPGTKDQTASSPTAGVAATASVCASDDLSPGATVSK